MYSLGTITILSRDVYVAVCMQTVNWHGSGNPACVSGTRDLHVSSKVACYSAQFPSLTTNYVPTKDYLHVSSYWYWGGMPDLFIHYLFHALIMLLQ